MSEEELIKNLNEILEIFGHLKNYGWISDIKKEIDTCKAIQSIQGFINLHSDLKLKYEQNLKMCKHFRKELNKQDKVINEMAKDKYENISILEMAKIGQALQYDPAKMFNGITDEEAINIIKQYFEKKVEV